ncbi:MAG: GntR family transcriptional regulator [Lachnospiraceae bacterium]|nr:GntR family transcriptional regulator [Lachnospiraceae bacterium]
MEWKINEDRPIWIQLKEHLGKQIVSGDFICGEKLPSVRELAKEAGVNPNTMQRALAALDQEGLIITNRTTGRCITKDQKKIDDYRKEMADIVIQTYLENMKELGYTKEEAAMALQKNTER